MSEFVQLEVTGGVALVRMDRPPANALDLALCLELGAALREAGERDDVGALVLWGGPKIFAAGADIKAMADWGPEEARPSVEALGAACDLLEALPKVAIAAVNGLALGGGLELALGADLRYLAEDAKVGQPEVRIGVIPGAGGTQRLTRAVGPGRARELIYSGRAVEAAEAVRIGLAERVMEAGDVLDAAMADARAFAEGPRLALAAAKASINDAGALGGPEGIAAERQRFLALFGTPDQREGMHAFLEKRPPRFGSGPST